MITAIHILGQIIVGVYFIYNAFNHFRHTSDLAAYTASAASAHVPAPKVAVVGSGILLLLGGLSVLFNIYMGVGILLLVIFLIPTSFLMHAYWRSENPGERASQRIAFMKNMALLGALLLAVTGWN